MLVLHQDVQSADTCTVNILPCRIHHDGPTKVTKRYWSPSTEGDKSKLAHFRGRRLRGRVVRLPTGYQGIVMKSTDQTLPRNPFRGSAARPHAIDVDDEGSDNPGEEEEEDEDAEPVRIAQNLATFDEIVVWGHDQLPASDDAFVKGVEEWISFAEAIHCPTAAKTETNSSTA